MAALPRTRVGWRGLPPALRNWRLASAVCLARPGSKTVRTHLAIGRGLTPLRDEGVLLVDSGQTYHDRRGFTGGSGRADPAAEPRDLWLREAMADGETRDRLLIAWEQAPAARQVPPHEDHPPPLTGAAGAAAGEPDQTAFHGHAFGKPVSGFRSG